MRRSIIIAFLSAVLAACGSNGPERDQQPLPLDSFVAPDSVVTKLTPRVRELTKYGTSSAIIRYRNHGLGRDQIFYFDRYGAREAIYTESGGKQTRDVPYDVTIHSGGVRVHYNRTKKQGIKLVEPNTPAPLLGTVPDLRTVKLASTGMHSIAGVRAEGVTFQRGSRMTLWMWKGVPVRVEEIRPEGDTLLVEATSVSESTVIPAGRFSVPDDVVLEQAR